MPSFLSEDSPRIYPQNADVLSLEPPENFGLANDKDKVNGLPDRHIQNAAPFQEAFDESSNSSTHDAESFDGNPMPSNDSTIHEMSMDSAPDVAGTDKSKETEPQGLDIHRVPSKEVAQPNGTTITTTLPDRTALPRRTPTSAKTNGNGVESHYTSSGDLQHNAVGHGAVSPTRQPVTGNHLRPLKRRSISTDAAHPPLETIPSQSEAFEQHSRVVSLTPASPTSGSPTSRYSPHRLSSPPIYSPSSTSSGQLPLSATAPVLKHRNTTLDVPKSGASRLSRDGMDTAQASGRFSPTVAGMGPRRASLTLARRNTRSMQSDLPRDEVAPDEDALRWAEAYRQKRASKRKRREEVDDDRVLVGTKVDESHANWVTAYNMLTGIRVSVSRTNAKLDRELTEADFEAKQKSTFDIAGNEMVPSAKYDFKFKDYAPWVFRRLRTMFHLDPADYLMSLTGKYILSELGSPGKSGSFFYFSRDYKYIIKTIHHSEHKFLRKVLRDYYRHVQENPNTLLSQFYGLHRVKMPYGKKIHFVVMNNLFPPHRDIHSTFDLKGSTYGRELKEEDLKENPRATLKDLNWLRRQRHLELGIEKKRLFLQQLQKDVVLLKHLGIMDYSLLVGVHDMGRGNEENLRDKTLQVFNPGGERAADSDQSTVLMRTPSKMENARKARELRQMIRQERPVPMGMAQDKMPDKLGEDHTKRDYLFNRDDGGFRATHENNSAGDEIYYLGVIDCLTHYGLIKKIENFWKGLTHDKSQISALPPDPYGDRFYHFIEGTTLSVEEIQRQEREREQEAARISAASGERGGPRTSWKKGSHHIPPMPNYLPPAPPGANPSPDAQETVDMAMNEKRKTDAQGPSERQVPDRTLKTNALGDSRLSLQHDPILPIVEEDGEHSRPRTPAKDKMPAPSRAPPPTPPKKSSLSISHGSAGGTGAHESNGTADTNGCVTIDPAVIKESLNKSLPPLPKTEETADSGVQLES